MLSAIALGVVLQSPPPAFSNFQAKLKGMRSLVVEFTLSESPGPVGVGSGSLVIGSNLNQRLTTRWGPIEYVFVQNAQGLVEFERSQKTYREYAPFEEKVPPPSGLEFMPLVVYPSMFVSGRLDIFAPSGTAWKTTGTDTYTAEFMTDMGPQRIEFVVTPDGTLKRFTRVRNGEGGQITTTLTFTRVAVNGTIPNPDFRPNPPTGYRAEALPREALPLSYGEKFPLKGWVGLDGKQATLGGRARMLVVVGAPRCAPTQALMSFLEKNVARLNLGNLTWILATDGKSVPGVAARWKQIRRANGLATDLLRSPGTPMMYLVEPDGSLVHVWQGYHSSMSSTVAAELRAAVQRKSK